MNGKTVEVDNTDAEGRLVLAGTYTHLNWAQLRIDTLVDAIYYASTEYKPHTLIDVATLTGACVTALGEIYSGVFTNSDKLWSTLDAAGKVEHDRFWRLPLDEEYGPQIYSSNADLQNVCRFIITKCPLLTSMVDWWFSGWQRDCCTLPQGVRRRSRGC